MLLRKKKNWMVLCGTFLKDTLQVWAKISD